MMIRGIALLAIAASLSFGAEPKSEQKTVTGWVIDSACAFTKGISKPGDPACAIACGKSGSPLVIVQDDGTIYWPIEETMPAASQNARLLPFAGKHVTASGKVFARNGTTAIVIDKINNAPQ
jgi:hypothetical protein